MGATRDKPRVNKSLLSLKAVVFFVISGITALHVLHATKPQLLGLNFSEYRTISIIAPFVSIIGPLIAGAYADRRAAINGANYGRTLRFLTAFFLIVTAIIYACLFAIPEVHRDKAIRPAVIFGCTSRGAVITQDRCSEGICPHWKEKMGSLHLTNCTYACQNGMIYANIFTPEVDNVVTPLPSTETSSDDSFDYNEESTATATESMRPKRSASKLTVESAEFSGEQLSGEVPNGARVKRFAKLEPMPPHVCITERDENGEPVVKYCHVFTNYTRNIVVDSVMHTAMNADDKAHSEKWCNYELDGFQCNIPTIQIEKELPQKNITECNAVVVCQVVDPYDSKDSVLAGSECIKTVGDLETTLGGYIVIRLLGDVFALGALTLLNTAIVIAVRETSEGRGEVCRQYVWGAIGYVLIVAPIDIFNFAPDSEHDAALVALILVIVCFLLGAMILVGARNMPLSPPEWWWHTKTGTLVYPMSAVRRYSPEIFLLTLVAILFGTFWSSIHSFLYWTFSDENAISYAGLILVLALLLNVDKFIEFCGHSNVFIAGFALYIIRFTALSGKSTDWLNVVMETLEPLILGVVWITVILYMRHVMPRKLTATGQALAVLAFFGIGKGCGALIGLARDEKFPQSEAQEIHQWLAVAACAVALIYFVLYNVILAPRCTAKSMYIDTSAISGSASQNINNGTNGAGSTGQGSTAGAALNSNGNYSQLRVYHNERGKKGQFRF